jgi:hypothetical protein
MYSQKLLRSEQLNYGPTSCEQIDNQNDECHDEKQVNQAAADTTYGSEQPENK